MAEENGKKKKPRKPVDIHKATNRALTDIKIFRMKGTIHEGFATAMHFGMSLIPDEWDACSRRLNEFIAKWPEQAEETDENRSRLLAWLISETRKDGVTELLEGMAGSETPYIHTIVDGDTVFIDIETHKN